MSLISPRATLAEYLRTLVGPWVVVPADVHMPEVVSLTILMKAPGDEVQLVHVLEFHAFSVGLVGERIPQWPSGAYQVEQLVYDGERLSLTTVDLTVQFRVDGSAPIEVHEAELSGQDAVAGLSAAALRSKHIAFTSQTLSADPPHLRAALVGPPQGAVFTPPREYVVSRDVKSILGLVAGIAVIVLGFFLIHATGGGYIPAWLLIVVGAYILVATVLDLALFPPWRW
jgi:hypothetical protein